MDEFSNGRDIYGDREFDRHVHAIHVSMLKTKLLKIALILLAALLVVAVFK